MGTSRSEPGFQVSIARGGNGGCGAGAVEMQAAAVLTESKHEVSIANQPGRGVRRDAKLLRKYPDIYRWPQEGGIAQEGIQGTGNQYQRLLGVAPLQRVVWVLCRDGEQRLAITGVVALGRPEVDRSWYVFFPGVAGSPVSLLSHHGLLPAQHRPVCQVSLRLLVVGHV